MSSNIDGLSPCAATCVVQSASSAGCSPIPDPVNCFCNNLKFQSIVLSCLTSQCSPAEEAAAVSLAVQDCAAAGVSISVPASATSRTSTSDTSSSSPASSTGSSTTNFSTSHSNSNSNSPTSTPSRPSPASLTATSPHPNSTSTTPDPIPTSTIYGSKAYDTGSIVGGVLGGLTGLLFILVLFWFCRRPKNKRRKRRRKPTVNLIGDNNTPMTTPNYLLNGMGFHVEPLESSEIRQAATQRWVGEDRRWSRGVVQDELASPSFATAAAANTTPIPYTLPSSPTRPRPSSDSGHSPTSDKSHNYTPTRALSEKRSHRVPVPQLHASSSSPSERPISTGSATEEELAETKSQVAGLQSQVEQLQAMVLSLGQVPGEGERPPGYH